MWTFYYNYVWLIRLLVSLFRHWGGGQASWGGRWGESWGCQGRGEVWDHHILRAPGTPTGPRGGRDPPRGHHDGGGCHEAGRGASDQPAPGGVHRGPRDGHQGRRERAEGEGPRGTHVSVKDPGSKTLYNFFIQCNMISIITVKDGNGKHQGQTVLYVLNLSHYIQWVHNTLLNFGESCLPMGCKHEFLVNMFYLLYHDSKTML